MASQPVTRRVQLPALHEFRFELDPNESLQITLIQGSAEVFGFELVLGQPHPFGEEARAAVWSPDGAEIEMSRFLLLWSSVLGGVMSYQWST